jgi:L-cysteine:1D-myo-inositol 2-amino-2-deoxy-alpha-D-glucopyranoside ligase
MVGFEGEKMSKSKGNLVLVSTLRGQDVDPAAIRLALLRHHYRSDWEWTGQELTTAECLLGGWRRALASEAGAPADDVVTQVLAALADDLDAPRAVGAVQEWARLTLDGDTSSATAGEQVRAVLDAALGLTL